MVIMVLWYWFQLHECAVSLHGTKKLRGNSAMLCAIHILTFWLCLYQQTRLDQCTRHKHLYVTTLAPPGFKVKILETVEVISLRL